MEEKAKENCCGESLQDLRRGCQVIDGKTNCIGFKLRAPIRQTVFLQCQLLGLESKQ